MKITNKEAFRLTFWIFGLIAVIGNFVFAIITKDSFAVGGWIVALCWFPYKLLKLEEKDQ